MLDAVGRRQSWRNRAGEMIGFGYDALDRVRTRTLPGNDVFTFTYDLVGRMETAKRAGETITYGHDTAGRVETVTDGADRTIDYRWDASGNRVRTTWPDGWYVTYAYDEMGRMTEIKELGTGTPLARWRYDRLSRPELVERANGAATTFGFHDPVDGVPGPGIPGIRGTVYLL